MVRELIVLLVAVTLFAAAFIERVPPVTLTSPAVTSLTVALPEDIVRPFLASFMVRVPPVIVTS